MFALSSRTMLAALAAALFLAGCAAQGPHGTSSSSAAAGSDGASRDPLIDAPHRATMRCVSQEPVTVLRRVKEVSFACPDLDVSATIDEIRDAGWRVVNLDATVVCERPKLGAYKATIRENVAKLLEVSVDAVSIKAKTNEKMDAVGREEGMVAQAIILLARDDGF